jgi:hypothetical protein
MVITFLPDSKSPADLLCMLGQGKNVKSIIDDWNSELQAQSRAFVADAQGLADWDKHIRLKRRELLEMEANLNRVLCYGACVCA